MAEVVLNDISKTFTGGGRVVSDLSITIKDREFVVLVGPSGCGKSTTLRMVAGLEEISAGEIYIGGRLMNDVPPRHRDIAMVFQNYALYPHMTVFDNVAFGLKLNGVDKKTIREKVRTAAEAVDMLSYLDRKPKALSGGQRQRVALARAIVRSPKVFLFDEPLSNLDAKLRVQMRIEIAQLQARMGTTTIYVTHDQTEAMTMADRIAVMKDGFLQQFDTPLNTYNFPLNRFVAGFIGSPAMNFIEGTVMDQHSFSDTTGEFMLSHPKIDLRNNLGREIVIGIRPEAMYVNPDNTDLPKLSAQVVTIEPMGNESFLHVLVGSHLLTARVEPDIQVVKNGMVDLFFPPDKMHYFDKNTGAVIN